MGAGYSVYCPCPHLESEQPRREEGKSSKEDKRKEQFDEGLELKSPKVSSKAGSEESDVSSKVTICQEKDLIIKKLEEERSKDKNSIKKMNDEIDRWKRKHENRERYCLYLEKERENLKRRLKSFEASKKKD